MRPSPEPPYFSGGKAVNGIRLVAGTHHEGSEGELHPLRRVAPQDVAVERVEGEEILVVLPVRADLREGAAFRRIGFDVGGNAGSRTYRRDRRTPRGRADSISSSAWAENTPRCAAAMGNAAGEDKGASAVSLLIELRPSLCALRFWARGRTSARRTSR